MWARVKVVLGSGSISRGQGEGCFGVMVNIVLGLVSKLWGQGWSGGQGEGCSVVRVKVVLQSVSRLFWGQGEGCSGYQCQGCATCQCRGCCRGQGVYFSGA